MRSKQLNSLTIAVTALITANLMGCNDAPSPRTIVKPPPPKAVEITVRALNDTGADKFLDATHAPDVVTVSSNKPGPRLVTNPVTQFPGQDAAFGRDKTAVDASVLNGLKGFSFVALDEKTGAELTAAYDTDNNPIFTNSQGSAVTPGCVKDRVTGLVWEYKNDIHESMHYRDHTFTWYNPDGNTNGGQSGQQASETQCTGMSAGNHEGIAGDTNSFIIDNNKTELCGFKDWRLPLVNELVSIMDYGATTMEDMTDQRYFGNLHGFAYHRWAAETLGTDPNMAWTLHIHTGQPEAHNKGCLVDAKTGTPYNFFNSVMLVRGDQ